MRSIYATTTNYKKNEVIEFNVRLYNLIIGIILCWGFFLNYLVVRFVPTKVILFFGFWPFIFIWILFCIVGIVVTASQRPLVSFLGYNIIVFLFGLSLNIFLKNYNYDLIIEAIKITGSVTALMMILGSIFPAFFKRIQTALSFSLISVVIIGIISIFVFKTYHGVFDWIIALIFCGYIGFDWSEAQKKDYTVSNAILSASSLYIDIAILFEKIVRILDE